VLSWSNSKVIYTMTPVHLDISHALRTQWLTGQWLLTPSPVWSRSSFRGPAWLIAVIVLWGRGRPETPQPSSLSTLPSALLPPGLPSDLSRLIPSLALNDSHSHVNMPGCRFGCTPHHLRTPARPRPMPSRFRGQSNLILTQHTLHFSIMAWSAQLNQLS
jgi:hypothetical protein